MGVTTSYFAATMEELMAAAPGWVVPRYGAWVAREGMNPFTREKATYHEHELLNEAPEEVPEDELHGLVARLSAGEWKLTYEVTALMKHMLGTDGAAAEQVGILQRLALLGPEDGEHWVFEVPRSFSDALAAVRDEDIPALAAAWNEEIEWKDPTGLLTNLIEVARSATDGRRMFAFTSL